ncbi:hypothetical protein [Sulfurimonas sp.]|uniref:hypothetical protein n=1 Tax=Sulfurimonas sp. TaxID=2022749 RepID=UPI002B45E5C8|nr:hypothetical protein [Sulfurimonas sp.]
MKKLNYITVGFFIVIGLSGCGASWANLDNTKANDAVIKSAKIKCQYNNKEQKLMRERDTNNYLISIANIEGKAKEKLLDINKEKKKEFNEEINSCMKKEGLQRKI